MESDGCWVLGPLFPGIRKFGLLNQKFGLYEKSRTFSDSTFSIGFPFWLESGLWPNIPGVRTRKLHTSQMVPAPPTPPRTDQVSTGHKLNYSKRTTRHRFKTRCPARRKKTVVAPALSCTGASHGTLQLQEAQVPLTTFQLLNL